MLALSKITLLNDNKTRKQKQESHSATSFLWIQGGEVLLRGCFLTKNKSRKVGKVGKGQKFIEVKAGEF